MKLFPVLGLAAAFLIAGSVSLLAGTGDAVAVQTGSRNITARATMTTKGVLVSGSVHRALGLGSGGGSIRVSVYSPAGKMVSCTTTPVTYPNRRPFIRARVGSFTATVPAAPGTTIRVGGCPAC